jgi:hypothetical protein
MENFLIGVGVFLATFGPLLLIPITWIIYRLVMRPLLRRQVVSQPCSHKVDLRAFLYAALLVAVILAFSYMPGKIEYNSLCDEYAQPIIEEKVTVDGFYRSRLYHYEAREFIEKGGFKFVEGPSPSQPKRYRRYSYTAEGEYAEEEIASPISQYGVRDDFWETGSGVIVSHKTVYERTSQRELARAANITYQGGPLWILLGSYATASCPDILSEQGSEDFMTYYNLETIVLNNQAEPFN